MTDIVETTPKFAGGAVTKKLRYGGGGSKRSSVEPQIKKNSIIHQTPQAPKGALSK